MIDPTRPQSTRRHFLAANAMGIGSLALAHLLHEEDVRAEAIKPDVGPRSFDLTPKQPHHPPRATAMISLFMQGGPSHIDMFDPKPEMAKWDGKKFPGTVKYDNAAQASSKVLHSPWKFQAHGECGMELSELLPHLSNVVDDITLVRSTRTGVNNHVQSIYALNNGRIQRGRPALGSWLTYGLGNPSQELPAYVAMTDPAGLPVAGVQNWSNGWLPSLYQGTVVRPQEPRILNLNAPTHLRGTAQRRYLDYVDALNQKHIEDRPGELDLQARIASYQLAARMQTAATEALDLSQETKATQTMYGMDDPATKDYGSRCLIARRLVERGVRFVQVFTQNQYWDHHGNIKNSLPKACKKTDQPSAALVADLKQRGLLDSTVVHWGGEMGRLPVIQNEKNIGRDHNTYGFSMWLAGGGFKGGCVHGETDDFGHHAVTDVVNHYDYHATLLHLFGLDPEKLSYKRNAREQTLLDGQPGRVVEQLLA
ncbi:hypothetical protein Mal52_34080 [Symmachiella dynata]|uniref:Sulfatase n=1 Tax=Symmachiella dynata TaxID=2527995 RepID=A0A517ZR04_9PLAN|nr:DUF1501 domain-containing protein [Symmachiella dynata]QDU44922.1 hypothetical protein Mal52_34080 [Symmachiella dynata]